MALEPWPEIWAWKSFLAWSESRHVATEGLLKKSPRCEQRKRTQIHFCTSLRVVQGYNAEWKRAELEVKKLSPQRGNAVPLPAVRVALVWRLVCRRHLRPQISPLPAVLKPQPL